jgi:acetyl-CoA carboxylase biotin carboxylase subunit
MRKVENVFIANRGEIALPTACACRELGLRAPQAYSEAGRDSLAVRLADKAICIGPASSQEGDSKQAALIEEQMWAGHPTQQML